jgi:DNA-binding NarL/FixJ family response regulator
MEMPSVTDVPINVLVVDGHDGVREALAQRLGHLSRIGHVTTATALESAVRMVRDQAPTVVLYDPRTVVGEAVDSVERLTQAGGRVIVLTSTLREDEPSALRQAGAVAVLLKGAESAALLELIEDALASRAGQMADSSSPTR